MTPAEIRAELTRLGLSQAGAAALLGVDPSTFRRWLMAPGTRTRIDPPKWLQYALAGMSPGGKLRDMAARHR